MEFYLIDIDEKMYLMNWLHLIYIYIDRLIKEWVKTSESVAKL